MLWNDDPWFAKTRQAIRDAELDGRTDDFERLSRQAYEKALETKEPETINEAWSGWIYFLVYASRYDEARIEAERFLADPGTERSPLARAVVLHRLSAVHYYCNRYQKASNIAQRLLSMINHNYPPKFIAQVHNHVALVKRHLGNPEEAIEHFNEALLVTKLNKLKDHGDIDGNLALLYEDLGRLGDALTSFQVALKKGELAGDEDMLVFAHLGLGTVNHKVGDFSSARDHLQVALAKANEINSPHNILILESELADLDCEEGNVVHAIDHITAALFLASEQKLPEMEADSRVIHGWILLKRGKKQDPQAALDEARHAAKIYKELGLGFGEVAALGLAVAAQLELKSVKAAVNDAEEILERWERDGENNQFTLFQTGRALEASGDKDRANDVFAEAHHIMQNKASQLSNELRSSFLARPRNRLIAGKVTG